MNAKRIVGAAVILLMLAGSGTALGKSKIWDLIFEEEETTTEPAPQDTTSAPASEEAGAYIIEIRMASGETFRMDSPTADFSDLEFSGPLKLDRQDGIFYLNSAQVQYIRVVPQ